VKIELAEIGVLAALDTVYGVKAQLAAQAAQGAICGVAVPTFDPNDPTQLPILNGARDDRIALGMAPFNLPAIAFTAGASPAVAEGEISQGVRSVPSIALVASIIVSDANAAAAWAQSDYLETALIRAFAQAALLRPDATTGTRVGGVQVEFCNRVTFGAVNRALKDGSGVVAAAVQWDLHVTDYQPTLIT